MSELEPQSQTSQIENQGLLQKLHIPDLGLVRRHSKSVKRIGAGAGIFAVAAVAPNVSTAQEASTESIAGSEFNSLVIKDQQDAAAAHPGMNLVGPSEIDTKYGLENAIYESEYDNLVRMSFKQTKKFKSNTFKVKLTQNNGRFTFRVAEFLSPTDVNKSNYTLVNRSYDSDILTRKEVVVTPMLRPRSGGKPRRFGRSVKLKDWTDLSPENLSKPEANDATVKDRKHIGKVTIKTRKPVTKSMMKSGRFYIDSSQSCEVVNPAYGEACGRILGLMFKVKKPKKSYVVGASPKGTVISSSRKKR